MLIDFITICLSLEYLSFFSKLKAKGLTFIPDIFTGEWPGYVGEHTKYNALEGFNYAYSIPFAESLFQK